MDKTSSVTASVASVASVASTAADDDATWATDAGDATVPTQTEVNALNQVELHATKLKYITMRKEFRPANTQDAYSPRQKEWREWCARKRYADGEIVTEGKMMTFLDQEVIGRAVRTKVKKKGHPVINEPEEAEVKQVGLASFKLYTAAIVDL